MSHSRNAAHAALLPQIATAEARLDAAVTELRQALVEVEALARVTARSDGQPIAVCIPPVAGGRDLTFAIRPSEIMAAILRISDAADLAHAAA